VSGTERITVSEEHRLSNPSANTIVEMVRRFLANPAVDPRTFYCHMMPCEVLDNKLRMRVRTFVTMKATTYERPITVEGEAAVAEAEL